MTRRDLFLARIAILTVQYGGPRWFALFCIMRLSKSGARWLRFQIDRLS
jgi:hypothetical protein